VEGKPQGEEKKVQRGLPKGLSDRVRERARRSPKAMAKLEAVGEMEENPKEPPPKVKYGLLRDEQEVFEWVKAERAKSPKSNRIHEEA
jgi:hypothetical protein